MPTTKNALRALRGIPSGAHAGKHAAGALVVVALASVGLSACGGGSSGTASSANAAATGASPTTTSTSGASGTSTSSASHPGAPGSGRLRFSAIRECLQKNGVVLPKPTQGGPVGLRGGVPGGPGLPKGVTTAKLQAALKKCGAGNAVRAFGGPNNPGPRRVNSPVFRQALAKYAECLRQNGVNIPAPKTSGKGPIFSTKGLNTSSPQFRAATMKCRATLIGAFRRLPRPNGASGTTHAGGQAQGTSTSG